MMNRQRTAVALATLGLVALALAACASQPQAYMDGSRSAIYESVRELAADATYAVTGDVVSQNVVEDEYGNEITLSALRIDELKTLGGKYTNGAPLAVGGIVTVRQIGTSAYAETLSPILSAGSRYLLFINPSELPGDDASQYFITGNTAGYYAMTDVVQHGAEPVYEKVGDEGDSLPGTLTLSAID